MTTFKPDPLTLFLSMVMICEINFRPVQSLSLAAVYIFQGHESRVCYTAKNHILIAL